MELCISLYYTINTEDIMKIINKTDNKIIADRLQHANNPFSRLVGLLLRKGLASGEGLLITPCNSIHSFGMRFNFDALFLDKDFRIVYLIQDMKPWRASKVIFSSHSVLELPAGTIKNTSLKLDDRLEIIF